MDHIKEHITDYLNELEEGASVYMITREINKRLEEEFSDNNGNDDTIKRRTQSDKVTKKEVNSRLYKMYKSGLLTKVLHGSKPIWSINVRDTNCLWIPICNSLLQGNPLSIEEIEEIISPNVPCENPANEINFCLYKALSIGMVSNSDDKWIIVS